MKGTAKEKVVYFHTSNSLETRRIVQELHFCGVKSSEKTKLRNTQTTESVQDHTTGTAIRIEGPNCLYWSWWNLFFFPYGTLTCNVINLTGSGERNVLLQNIKMIILTFLTTDFDFISKIKKKQQRKQKNPNRYCVLFTEMDKASLPCWGWGPDACFTSAGSGSTHGDTWLTTIIGCGGGLRFFLLFLIHTLGEVGINFQAAPTLSLQILVDLQP